MRYLEEYENKRDFNITPEPTAKRLKRNLHRFVIQQHAATRLHYDLRLEHHGVLLSWAVPKEPTSDTSTKRLAIQTEDHPVSYLHFEGTIPEGEYGGGNVIVWDTGTYLAPAGKKARDLEEMLEEQYRHGHIHLFFSGKKLKGEYALVRTDPKQRHWLFFKVEDEYANGEPFDPRSVISGKEVRKKNSGKTQALEATLSKVRKGGIQSPFPEPFSPMLATLSGKTFSSPSWIYEVKYDGYRCLVFKKGNKVTFYSRNRVVMNNNYPDLVQAASAIPGDFVADGEIIAMDETGGGSFQLLQQYLKTGKKTPLKLVLFDLVYLQGWDISALPLVERKALLETLLEPVQNNLVRYSTHIKENGEKYLAATKQLGLEGIIAKRSNSPYIKNKRTDHWLKMKNVSDDDLVVVGVTKSPTSERAFAALLLARPDEGGRLTFAGKVGTGFGMKQTFDLEKLLKRSETPTPPVQTREKVLFWVKPKYYAQVKYTEVTQDGKLRHPVFMALRDDKFYLNGMERTEEEKKTAPPKNKGGLSNLDKVFFPKSKLTKGDVIEYYSHISKVMLPYLKDRPMTLKRNPNGITDEGFYQKDVPEDVPSFLHTIHIESKSSEKEVLNYAMCNNRRALVFLANWGCIEMHVWNSRQTNISAPDHIVFDLDPQNNTMAEVKTAATVLKEMLDEMGLYFGLKTSGGDGLHFYIPLVPGYTHEQAREAAHVIGKLWLGRIPRLGSLERMPAKRNKKIYLDYLQNAKGKTMVAPYSLRAREGAPVSTPITWEEFEALSSPKDLNIKSTPALIKERGDVWKNLYRHRIKLETLVEKIERLGSLSVV